VNEWRKPALARWKLRLLVETGFVSPAPVQLPPLPYGVPESVATVYDGIRELYGVRWLSEDVGSAAPLVSDFLAAWCAVSEKSADRAKGVLSQHEIITPGEMFERCRLWLPGGAPNA
jgi:hypothetical protein